MSESRSHKTTANRLAKIYNTQNNQGKGVDIKTDSIAIEVETPESITDAGQQLKGHSGPVYVAGTNQQATELALKYYKDTTIGVMDNQGKILKPSTRK